MLRKALNLWFSFSRGERMGIYVLLALIFLVSLGRWYFTVLPATEIAKPTEGEIKEVERFRKALYIKSKARKQKNGSEKTPDKKKEGTMALENPEGPVIVEVNTGGAAMLQGIKGIGPALSKRVLAYRQKLGGFYSPEQLREVKGIGAKTLEKMMPFIRVDTNHIRKLSVMGSDKQQLMSHPYISEKLAGKIITERRDGEIQPEELRRKGILNKKDWQRLKHYLKP